MAHVENNAREIKKLHLKAVVIFAIEHVPRVDSATLEALLDLVSADGTFGTISEAQLLVRMMQIQKHLPDACPHSLTVVSDLLEIRQGQFQGTKRASLTPGYKWDLFGMKSRQALGK